MNALQDKRDNFIGDGTYHVDYEVIDFKKLGYDYIKSEVSFSDTTESVYVYYINQKNNEVAVVRFSTHTCNAVKFGIVLEHAIEEEILYKLGIMKRKRVEDKETRLSITSQQVKKVDAYKYEEAPLTIQEMYALGAEADLSQYKGKLAKGSRYLILGDKVREFTDVVGAHYEYYNE